MGEGEARTEAAEGGARVEGRDVSHVCVGEECGEGCRDGGGEGGVFSIPWTQPLAHDFPAR